MKFPFLHILGAVLLMCTSMLLDAATLIPEAATASFDPQHIAEVMFFGRSIERVLIVLFSGLSIVLGFFLFRVVISDAGSAEAQLNGLRFTAKRIGPGVFFCMFGVVGMTYSIESQPTLTITKAAEVKPSTSGAVSTNVTASEKEGEKLQILGLALIDQDKIKKSTIEIRILSLNLLLKTISRLEGEGKVMGDKSLGQAITAVRLLRDQMIPSVVGQSEYEKYLLAEIKRREFNFDPAKDQSVSGAYAKVERLKTEVFKIE
jgi:hypothetical protein